MKIVKQLTAKVVLCAILVTFVFGNTNVFTIKAYGATSFNAVLSASFTALQEKMESFEGKELSENWGAEWPWGEYHWGVCTLAENGKLNAKIREAYIAAVKEEFKNEDPEHPSFAASKYATAVIVLKTCGVNVRSFDGKDLLKAFKDPGCVETGYASNTAYIMVAIDKAGAASEYRETMDAAVEYMENQQGNDGSFGYDYGGYVPDIDTTGMVLEGLASYQSGAWKASASTAVKKAVRWIKTQKPGETGLYEAWGSVNAATTAVVTIGLAANGINPLTVIKADSGKTALDGFLSVYDGKGSFGATDYQSQTLRAMTALRKYTEQPKTYSSYSDSSTVAAKPVKTGTWNDPVTDGTWKQNADGSWQYETNALFRSTWGYIAYTGADGTQKNAWFYFDQTGKMLTGWQLIGGRWYYLNPVSDGNMGACLLNIVTPDGYTVDENGAWTVNGVVQENNAQAAAAAVTETVSETSGESSGSEGSGSEEKPKTYSFSVSISADVKTDEGKKVSFSASRTIKAEEGETYTAYDALEALCEDKGYEIEGDSSYVSAINGLAEFDAGAASGWMYSVNGKFPNVAAGEYEIRKGDRIRWVYVTKYVDVSEDF